MIIQTAESEPPSSATIVGIAVDTIVPSRAIKRPVMASPTIIIQKRLPRCSEVKGLATSSAVSDSADDGFFSKGRDIAVGDATLQEKV